MTDTAAQIKALRTALAAAEARAEMAESRTSEVEQRAAFIATEAAQAKAAAAHAQALVSSSEALIAHLRLEIEKLRRELYGQRSERKQRLLEQMELQLEEMEASASEDEALAEAAAAKAKTTVAGFTRAKPVRKPFPEHLPRERVVLPAPCSCAACGSARLAKMGEDVTETLEVVPRSWKVIQTVREKFPGAPPVRASKRPQDALPLRGPALTLPGLRAHQPAAGAVPSHAPRLGRPQPSGDDRVRERAIVRHWSEDNGERPASAPQPPG